MKHWKTTLSAILISAAFIMPGTLLAQDKPEIYSKLPNSALVGVFDPDMPDRSDIEKALPEGTRDNSKPLVIGWTEITLGNPWFVAAIDYAQKAAEEYGYELDVQVADGDPTKTSAQVDSFIARQVDVIVIDPTDLASAAGDAQRAVDAGIPVIMIGTVPDDSPIITTVTWNPFKNGFLAGQYTAKQFDANTPLSVANIIGRVGNSTSESRVNGMMSGFMYERGKQLGKDWSEEEGMLAGFDAFQDLVKSGSTDLPDLNMKFVTMGVGDWTEEGGLNAAEDILTAHGGDLGLILAGNDFMGMGAIRAIQNNNMQDQVKVAASADGFRTALEMVKSGELMATGLFSGSHVGQGAIELIHDIYDEGFDANNLPMGSFFEPDTVTPKNVDQYIDNDDPSNPFFKYEIPPFKTIPELRAEAGQ